MEVANLIAAWITAVATAVLAVAAWKQLPYIARQMGLLAEQIRLSRDADLNAERRTREWETLKACQYYDFDPVLDEATKRIWKASSQGKNYKDPNVDPRDVVCVLNYLDGLAVGIDQKLYIEDVVRDHLGLVFDHHVTNFLDGGIVPRGGFDKLTALHARWFKVTTPTGYQSSPSSH